MKPFENVFTVVTPLDRANVDTDQIIPKQFLKLVQKTGFGRYLFYNWRFDAHGDLKDFVLNDPQYDQSAILVAGDNFGCGSSREHAVWALQDYGFSVVIAPSFADIFHSNCIKNGVLAIRLDPSQVEILQTVRSKVKVNLEAQTITTDIDEIPFEIDSYRKKILLEGLDDIALTMKFERQISEFEKKSTVPSVL